MKKKLALLLGALLMMGVAFSVFALLLYVDVHYTHLIEVEKCGCWDVPVGWTGNVLALISTVPAFGVFVWYCERIRICEME